MFYSDSLLQKTGPLARVWLSANMERKLSKTHILQSNLQDSVEQIIDDKRAPMALRLSGQLLLGVVRIYSRKARYLLDDCNEALMKIKMAFRSSGDHDVSVSLQVPNREALNLPNRITPHELDMTLVELSEETHLGMKGRLNNRDINLQEDFNNSQFLQDGDQQDELDLGIVDMDGLNLDLDFGMDLDDRPAVEKSIEMEMGRDAPEPRDVEEDIFSDLGVPMGKDGRDRELSLDLDFGDNDNVRIADGEGDLPMFDDGDFEFNIGDQSAAPVPPVAPERARISESPLSDIDPEFAEEIEMEYSRTMNADMYEPGNDTEKTVVRNAPQRAKKRRLLVPDSETMLTSNHIRAQQDQHDNILKPQSFIPREPYVLALMEMQKSGGFVSNIMLEGRSDFWAPELKGLLSLTALRQPNDLKRKRDSGIADMDSDQEQAKSPRLELNAGDDDLLDFGGDEDFGDRTARDGTVLEIPADDGIELNNDDEGHGGHHEPGSPMPAFDETMAPRVHPADSGLVSVGTKHAVHILRDLFGAEAATNADKRKKASVVFQELLPEARTTKADATKMFFECLVLATKDAIKVEQPEGVLGGPIRVRGKRGLWGAWAEREAGGEMASQMEEQQEQQQPPEPPVAGPSVPTVSVEA